MLAFYLDTGEELPRIFLKHAKAGNTISIMYAEQHNFLDGQCGLRIEDVSCVKVSYKSGMYCRVSVVGSYLQILFYL